MKKQQTIRLPDGSDCLVEIEIPDPPFWQRRCCWWEFVAGAALLVLFVHFLNVRELDKANKFMRETLRPTMVHPRR